jgi:hypothetical protein
MRLESADLVCFRGLPPLSRDNTNLVHIAHAAKDFHYTQGQPIVKYLWLSLTFACSHGIIFAMFQRR